MTPEDIIRDDINAHIDATAALLETTVGAVARGASRLAQCLVEERRLFVCGMGSSAATAEHLGAKLLGRLERERPGLPVFNLGGSTALLTSVAGDHGLGEIYSRPLRALGQPGDVLVAISATGMSGATVQAIVTAQGRAMAVVALTGFDGGDVARVLTPDDIEIRVPSSSPVRTEEAHLLLVNILCDLLERELFGDLP